MKRLFVVLMAAGMIFAAAPVMAEYIYESYDAPPSNPNQDTSVVDLSDTDESSTVNSPSFENTTPAGQAPGGPIEQ